ncbi:MAG: HRDC domain-containing protein [Acholeplasmataceae bacterium]|nr:HRDC domain-containing protein [Acholeplasmataceae bacterium]
MGLLDKIFGYGEIKGPEFTKDFSVEDNSQINNLLLLLERVTDESKLKIEKELLNMRSGLSGEKNVYFELKNSRLPIVCLHDIRLEYKNYEAQFDFIVIASEFILVLETKKLFGNITIDNEGNFTREYQINNRLFKEGMYSPITQNERHIRLLEEFLKDKKLIKYCPIHSLIVIANDKTIVNKKYAKADVKNVIIKHDQLIEKLNQFVSENDSVKLKHNYMREIAEAILKENKPIEYDYIKKLGLEMKPTKIETPKKVFEEPILLDKDTRDEEEKENDTQSKLHNKLKQYRYKKSKELNIKAYYVFNNNELDQLVLIKPKTKEQFLSVQGFGEKKFEQYGEDIIDIIKESLNQIEEALKTYRSETAKMNNLKAYEVFNNQQLEQILELFPKDKEQLTQIKYYSKQQIENFGDQIITIIKENL